MNQKQVAYLAPTTILASQQYDTFKERMKEYPIRIELLNRFIPSARQKEIIKGLKTGEVDIVIGTHKLLNDEIEYIMSKEEIINQTISNFRDECSKLTESEFIDKLHKH